MLTLQLRFLQRCSSLSSNPANVSGFLWSSQRSSNGGSRRAERPHSRSFCQPPSFQQRSSIRNGQNNYQCRSSHRCSGSNPIIEAPRRFYGARNSGGSSSVDRKDTFVSKHYRMDPSVIESYLNRKHLRHQRQGDLITVQDCPFCPKPTRGQRDNQHKLYIWPSGSYFCHRCSNRGTWFKFKRHFGDLSEEAVSNPLSSSTTPVANYPGRGASGGSGPMTPAADAASSDPRPPQPSQEELHKFSADLQSFPEAVEFLTKTRGLSPSVLTKYGVGAGRFGFRNSAGTGFEQMVCITFPWARWDADSGQPRLHIDRLKVRAVKDKSCQRITPTGGTPGFFGWHTVPASAREIVITEGEFDAMAVFQATGRPAISLPNGARSLPVELLPALERFDKIYLWMDSDQPGREGAEQFARKLGLGRTLMVDSGPTDKDANDALRREGADLEKIISVSGPIPHREIVTFEQLRRDVHQQFQKPFAFRGVQSNWMPSLNRLLKGLRRGELTVLTGPTGSGKTTVLSQLSLDYCVSAQPPMPTLWGSFEIKNSRLAKTMLSQFSGLDLSENLDQFDRYADSFGQLPLYFLRFFGSTSVDQVTDAMEYAVYVHDVQHIVIDNLQFMLSGQHGSSGRQFDKFEMQDRAVEVMRRFASQHNVHITLVIHPRKESDRSSLGISSVFGGAKATQEADNVLILQRHSKDESVPTRMIEVKKNRFDGDCGTVHYRFERSTARVIEIDPETGEDLPLAPLEGKDTTLINGSRAGAAPFGQGYGVSASSSRVQNDLKFGSTPLDSSHDSTLME